MRYLPVYRVFVRRKAGLVKKKRKGDSRQDGLKEKV